MRRLDNEPVALQQSVQGLGQDYEVFLLRAEVEQQRKEIQHLRGQLLQKSPETPTKNGVPAASKYHRISVVHCPDPVSGDDVTEVDGRSEETIANVAQETLLVHTPGTEHDGALSSTPVSNISLSRSQMLASGGASGSPARRSRSTGSAKSRSPSREPRQCMVRNCILVPECQLRPPATPLSTKPRQRSKERQESKPHARIPLSTGRQTPLKHPRQCKLESCPRPRPVNHVSSKASPAKAEGAPMQLQPRPPSPQPAHHQSDDGMGVAQPAQMASGPAAPGGSVAFVRKPSTPALGARHVLHLQCATPRPNPYVFAGKMADVARPLSMGEGIRTPAYPRVDATASANHLSNVRLAMPPLALRGTTGTQLGHGQGLADQAGLHCFDGRTLLDRGVETLPRTGRLRSTSMPASKRKVIVAL